MVYCASRHFQQYVSFIGGGNRITRKKTIELSCCEKAKQYLRHHSVKCRVIITNYVSPTLSIIEINTDGVI
jgi:hypothetical protein